MMLGEFSHNWNIYFFYNQYFGYDKLNKESSEVIEWASSLVQSSKHYSDLELGYFLTIIDKLDDNALKNAYISPEFVIGLEYMCSYAHESKK